MYIVIGLTLVVWVFVGSFCVGVFNRVLGEVNLTRNILCILFAPIVFILVLIRFFLEIGESFGSVLMRMNVTGGKK